MSDADVSALSNIVGCFASIIGLMIGLAILSIPGRRRVKKIYQRIAVYSSTASPATLPALPRPLVEKLRSQSNTKKLPTLMSPEVAVFRFTGPGEVLLTVGSDQLKWKLVSVMLAGSDRRLIICNPKSVIIFSIPYGNIKSARRGKKKEYLIEAQQSIYITLHTAGKAGENAIDALDNALQQVMAHYSSEGGRV